MPFSHPPWFPLFEIGPMWLQGSLSRVSGVLAVFLELASPFHVIHPSHRLWLAMKSEPVARMASGPGASAMHFP